MPDVSPVQACGKLWHPEHFVCVNCDTHLGDGKVDYVEEDGDPYCAPCFETLYRTCPGCKMLISDNELNQCLKAPPVPGVWHAEHFRCAAPGCKKKLDGSYYDHEYNGVVSPFCKEHYEVLFLVPCTKCGEPITERYFENEGKAYHSHCWTCTHCDCDLKDGYVMQLGAPYVFRFLCWSSFFLCVLSSFFFVFVVSWSLMVLFIYICWLVWYSWGNRDDLVIGFLYFSKSVWVCC